MTASLFSDQLRAITAGMAQVWLDGKFGADISADLDLIDAKANEAITAVLPAAAAVSAEMTDRFAAILQGVIFWEADAMLKDVSLQPAVHAAVLMLRAAHTSQVLRFLQVRWPGQYVTSTVRYYLNRLAAQGHLYKQVIGDKVFYTAENDEDLEESGNGSD